ncbi:MAG: hypothetical protein CMM47_02545 [Rhodospirillaceae bacterium]|nr:hypothetical protein [Rhodospirillaceae bacterium]
MIAIGFLGTAPVQADTAYQFSFKPIEGKPLPLANYRDKAVLVVNTALHCDFAQQYVNLQNLSER